MWIMAFSLFKGLAIIAIRAYLDDVILADLAIITKRLEIGYSLLRGNQHIEHSTVFTAPLASFHYKNIFFVQLNQNSHHQEDLTFEWRHV